MITFIEHLLCSKHLLILYVLVLFSSHIILWGIYYYYSYLGIRNYSPKLNNQWVAGLGFEPRHVDSRIPTYNHYTTLPWSASCVVTKWRFQPLLRCSLAVLQLTRGMFSQPANIKWAAQLPAYWRGRSWLFKLSLKKLASLSTIFVFMNLWNFQVRCIWDWFC